MSYPGYPPQSGGYPPQAGGYPSQPGAYPPQAGGYPPAQGGYPPAQGGYPPAAGGYPPQAGGYPPQAGGYPPAAGGYPPAAGGYPPQAGGYPPAAGGFPPQSGGYQPQPGAGGYPSMPPPAGEDMIFKTYSIYIIFRWKDKCIDTGKVSSDWCYVNIFFAGGGWGAAPGGYGAVSAFLTLTKPLFSTENKHVWIWSSAVDLTSCLILQPLVLVFQIGVFCCKQCKRNRPLWVETRLLQLNFAIGWETGWHFVDSFIRNHQCLSCPSYGN